MQNVYHFRQRKDDYFANDPSSPLGGGDFSGLSYYPVTEKFVFGGQVKPFETQEEVELQTSVGDTQVYLRYGQVTFALMGQHTLTLFAPPGQAPGRVFIPFKDLTNGYETYGAGRYLESVLKNGRVHLDFNQAYNPYCAYSQRYRCPLPPLENHLNLAVRAGEKVYEGAVRAD